VGGMRDIEKKTIRTIGDPDVRFQEDPVRMMRAAKFSSRLGFKIEAKTLAAMKRRHACIRAASVPRVCEEVFRLFPYGESAKAFKILWETGLLGDLLPELAAYIESSGGAKSPTWKHLKGLDAYEKMMAERGFEVSNGLRSAVLMTGLYNTMKDAADSSRKVMHMMSEALKIPKATYFQAVLLLESPARLMQRPSKGKTRFIHNRDFLDALDYNRIIARAEKRSEETLNQWSDLYEEKGTKK